MTRVAAPWALAAALIGAVPSLAGAQTGPPGRIEVAVGVVAIGQANLGSADATLTTPTGSTLTLFKTSTVLRGAPGLSVRAGARVWRGVEAETSLAFSRHTLATAISSDLEAGAPATATESVEQFIVGGGALWYLPGRFSTERFSPFLGGGIAYLRQLHEARTLAVTGRAYDAGAGVKLTLKPRPFRRPAAFGLRGDFRIVARSRGVAFDDAVRWAPAASASLFFRF